MTGGIMAGGSQVISGGFKIAAQLGTKTGKAGGIKLGKVKFYLPMLNGIRIMVVHL